MGALHVYYSIYNLVLWEILGEELIKISKIAKFGYEML